MRRLMTALLSLMFIAGLAEAATKTFMDTDSAQTATNKTLTSPTITGTVAGGATYSSPILTTPIIGSFTEAGLPAAGTAGRLARVTDGIRGIWKDTGTKWVSVTGYADLADWGFSTSASAATNATALQAAIDSGAAIVRGGSGLYSYSTGLTIDRAIRIDFAGAAEANGVAGTGSTELAYTGTGIGIDIIGSGANGKENIHLSNFILTGTVAATGGIYAGSGINVTRSSLKNIEIKGFTITNGYGLRFGNFLESVVENVNTRANYDGVIQVTGKSTTTLEVKSCYSGSNTRYGLYLTGTFFGSSFYNFVSESNGSNGLYIHGAGVRGLTFYSPYFESNNTTAGTEQILVTGAGGNLASDITFYNLWDTDNPAGTRTFEIFVDAAERIQFFYPKLVALEYVKVGTLTSRCEVYSPTVRYTDTAIVGNTTGQMRIHTIQLSALVPQDATPSVGGQYPNYITGNASATTITNLDDGFDGQVVTLTCNDAFTTIAHGGNFSLARKLGFFSGAYSIADDTIPSITLIRISSVWREVSRTRLLRTRHDYGGAAVDWTLATGQDDGEALHVVGASGNVNAILPASRVGKTWIVMNESGFILTFKVTGQTGGTIANGKMALYASNPTDVFEVWEQP